NPKTGAPLETPTPAPAPLRVVALDLVKPTSFADAAGQPAGIAMDCFDLVRGALDLRIRDVRVMPPDQAREALRAGDADLVIGVLKSDAWLGLGRFTAPFFVSPSVLITRKQAAPAASLAGLAHRRLATWPGHAGSKQLHNLYPDVELVDAGPAPADALSAVLQERADAALLYLDVARAALAEPRFSALVISGFPPDLPGEFAFLVSEDRSGMVAQLDRALASITPTQRSEILNRWLPAVIPTRPAPTHWAEIALALVVAAMALAAFPIALRLVRLRRDFARQKAEAEESRRRQQQAIREAEENSHLTAYLAHETRNLIFAIEGSMALLARDPGPVAKGRLADSIDSSTKALSALLDVTLDHARADAGQFEPHLAPTDLSRLVRRVVQEFEPLASRKKLSLQAMPAGASLRIVTDETRVGQIVRNLVVNAIKFTRQGSIVVRARRTGPEEAELEVTDTGGGIPADQLAAIFAPFERGSADRERAQGTGLGLSLSLDLARLLGGDVRVASVEGAGTTFTLVLRDHAGSRARRPETIQISSAPG
ncbi:MAG TPA: ATP-binding protein, partial [Burkholderiaceae bacterium]